MKELIPYRQIRACYDDTTIRVYQAYRDEIANAALTHGNFAPPYKYSRMTWIKPSFLWMMYRCGYGFKDEGQARILAMDITREGFEWALSNACLSHPPAHMHGTEEWKAIKDATPVRIQWDPERDLKHNPMEYRSIQIGLSEPASRKYVKEWIVNLREITSLAHEIYHLVQKDDLDAAEKLLPQERPYPLSPEFMAKSGIF